MLRTTLALSTVAFLVACGSSSPSTTGTPGTTGATGSAAGSVAGSSSGAAASASSAGSGSGVAASSTGSVGSTTSGPNNGASSTGGGSGTTNGGACVPGTYDGGVPPGAFGYDGGLPAGDCAPDGVCRFPPNNFRDAVGFSASDIWAVDGNAVYHLTGGAWTLVFGGLGSYAIDGGTQTGPNAFTSIWGSSDSDLWVGGYDICGAVLHFDGTNWLQVSGTAVACLEPVTFNHGISFGPSDSWMTSKAVPVTHWDGCTWTPSPGAPTGALAIWGVSGSDLWAGGDVQAPNLHHWDGTEWTSYPNPAASTQSGYIFGIWGSSSTDVWAVGDDVTNATWGTILHWDGHSWTQVTAPAAVYPLGIGSSAALLTVWGSSSTDVWMGAGYPGTTGSGGMLHYDGKNWTVADVPWATGGVWNGGIARGINKVWGSGQNNVYAFGEQGTILSYNGGNWSYLAGISGNDLLGIWSSAKNDVYAVSSDATPLTNGGVSLMHYDGHLWNTLAEFNGLDSGVTNRPYSNLTGNSDKDLWVAGYSGAFHWDGAQLTFNSNGIEQFNGGPVYPTFYGVFQDTSTNLWMVGQNGIVYQGSGVSGDSIGFNCVQDSIAPYYGAGNAFHSVYGLHGGPLYIVGDSHTVGTVKMDSILIGQTGGGARTNCAGNCCMEGLVDVSIADVAAADGGGIGPAEFYAVFIVPTPADSSAPADVWIAGYQDTNGGAAIPYVIHSTDQETWKQEMVPSVGTGVILTGIWGSGESDIWFVGKDAAQGQGWLYHWDGKSITSVPRPDPLVEGNYTQVWGTSATDVWAAGVGSNIVHFSGL